MVSTGGRTPAFGFQSPGDYAAYNSNQTPDGTLLGSVTRPGTFAIRLSSFQGWHSLTARPSAAKKQRALGQTMRRRELLAGAAVVLAAGRSEAHAAPAAPWSSGSEAAAQGAAEHHRLPPLHL